MILYANRKFLVYVKRVKEDGVIHTKFADNVPVRAGEILAHDQDGNVFTMTEGYFNKNYLAVEKVHRTVARKLSPFEEQYKKESLESNKPL